MIDIDRDYRNVIETLKKKGTVLGDIFQQTQKYAVDGRWWDIWHNEITTMNMTAILEKEGNGVLWEVLIPAAILHDIGWAKLGDRKNTKWNARNLRIAHMKLGGKMASDILHKIGYSEEYVIRIRELVEHHDDEYLGIKPKSLEMKFLRDADATFILSYPSFWKDWNVEARNLSPMIFLKKQKKKYGKRFTKTAQRIVDNQVQEREKEIEDKTSSFEDYVKNVQEIAEAKKNKYQSI